MGKNSPARLRITQKNNEVWQFLAKKYPKSFTTDTKRKVVINPTFKLNPFLTEISEEGGFTKAEVKTAIDVYFKSVGYLKAIIHEHFYHDFNGNNVGSIEFHHKDFANQELEKRIKKHNTI